MPRFPSEALVPAPPEKAMNACVVLPARNEEELLPGALYALAEQNQLGGGALPRNSYEVILLINNTTDASREAAERIARIYPSFRLHVIERWFKDAQAHIGSVRRLLMDEACRRLEMAGAEDGLILSTDSDSHVAPNWIARNRQEVKCGAEAVGGRIVVAGSEQTLLDPNTRQFQDYDDAYRRLVSWLESQLDPEEHDPWPRHHCHFGASLAITPRAYKRVGRLPPRRYLEDLALYQQLLRHDVKLRHSNNARVYTSARLTGRADFGFSRTLADVQRQGTKSSHIRVESKPFLEFLFVTRHELRAAWRRRHFHQQAAPGDAFALLASATGINKSTLSREVYAAQYFGSLLERLRFYEACRSAWPDWKRLAPLSDVAEDLYATFKRTTRSRQKAIHYQPM